MRKNKVFLLFFLFLSIIIYTVAYSGLATELSITSNVKFRPIVDIRIENIVLKEATNGAVIQYEPNLWEPDWNVAQTITGFKLPNSESSITYEVTVKNYGDVDQCIYSTSMDDESVNYQITGYTIKEIISAGQEKKFNLTFTPNTPSEEIRNIIVHYEFRKVFRVEYNANGGTNAPSMQRKYEREDLTLTTDVPTYTGHMLRGWSTNSSDNTVQYQPGGVFTLDQDTILYAKWQTTKVSIKMDMNGGTLSANKGANVSNNGSLILVDNSDIIHELTYGTSLPTGGLMDYNDIQNINIEKTGYNAVSGSEWNTASDGTGTSFNQNTIYSSTDLTTDSSQDTIVTLYVNWEPTTYSITYDLNGGSLEDGVSNPNSYNIETPDFTLNNPTKEGSVFLGWKEFELDTPVTTKTITTGTTGNKTLTAVFESVEKPTISHSPTTWTNQDVTATISSTHEDYTFMYKIDDGSFVPYNKALTITQNCTITAYSIKDGVQSSNETHIVDNIDKMNPTLSTLSTDNITSDGFDIIGTAQDQESGLTELRIYIKKSIDADFTYVTSINYSTDTTLLKNYSYSFTNLDSDSTYTAKVIGYDLAGNISMERTVNATTSEDDVIVARLIGYNNNDYDCDLNPALCKTFSTLKSALEYTGSAQDSDSRNCMTNQCTIQMLDSVAESNEILNGQEITLDLNGYTINGVLNYTFTNNGEFTIIDSVQFDPEEDEYNELNHNCIKNTTGTAIINNNVLNLGKYGTTDYVSIYEPYIYGATTGINTTNGTFNFYDGRIRATTAISGRVEDRPPMYDANVEIFSDPTSYQVATLSILSDAEARIDNKYYTKVATAVEDAKNAIYVDVLETDDFYDSFTNGNYGFVKSGNFLVNENVAKYTTATASMVLDLRDYDTDQLLDISTLRTVNQSSTTNNSYSNISIGTYSGDSGSVSYYMYPSLGELSNTFVLPKGSRYNITLNHAIYSDSYPEDCKLYITNMTLRDYEREEPSPYADMETTDVSTNYGFDYDPVTKSYKSNNQYTSNTTAFSYYEIDLTNETNNKLLIINATLSNNGSHYGYIYAKTDNNKETSYSSSNVMLSISNSGNQNYGPITATKELQAGQKYYVQFYYQKNYDSYNQAAYESMGVKDQFIINSMDLVDKSIINENSIDLSTSLVTPGDYGFTANTTINANSSETIHSYVAVDLTNTSTETYAELDFNSYYRFYTVVTDSPTLPTDYSNSVYHNPIEGPTYYGPVTFDLEPNKVNYIHFIMPPAPTGNTMLKTLKICNGKSYDIVNDFKKSTGTSYGMSNYRMSYPIAMQPSGTPADSYTEIDLRNSTSDVLLSVDAILASSYLSYIYVSENDIAVNPNDLYNPQKYDLVQNLLFKYNGSQGYAYINGDSYNFTYNTNTYNFVLSRGKKYYLHIGGLNTSFYVNKVITRNISSYDLKIGKSNFVDKSQVSYEEIAIDEDDESLRYVGSNPNNYVSFNNETWRMVGIFNTEDENGVVKPRIKLIKEGDIGSYSYDTSITDNNSTGVNEWSESDIMKLLNPGYSNNQEELFSLETPPSTQTKYSHTSNISDDMTVNGNYGTNLATKDVVTIPGATKLHVELRYGTENSYDKLYVFKGEYTGTISSSTTGYYSRYMGGNNNYRYTSFDIEGDTVTFGFYSDVSVTYWGYHAIVTDAHDPVMTSIGTLDVNNSLYWDKANGRCFNNSNNRASSCYFSGSGMDSAYKDYIDTVVWHTGAIPDSISGLSASEILAYEQGTNTGKTNYTSQGSVDDSVTRTSTWVGKVGLPSPSDYLYASTWIRNGSGAWFINPVYNSTLDKISYGNSSSIGYDSASYNYAIRPTVYLSTKTVIASGDGSSTNPYVLSLGQTDNPDMNNYYGLNDQGEEEDTGTVIYDETTDYQNIKDDTVYGFDYNENGYYMNNNTGQLNSTAATYLEIDMTAELEPALVQLKSFLPNSLGNGLIVIMEDTFDPNVNINNSSTYSNYKYFNVSNSTGINELVTFEPGKKYYLYMLFNTNSSNYGSVMVVYLNGLSDTTPTTSVTRYMGQEKAVEEETVHIIKDISMANTLTIASDKEVILDLNGHTLTTSASSPVITNNGTLKIIDSQENGGAINATTNSGVLNNSGSSLNVESGTININNSSYSAVDNYSTVTLGEDATLNVTNGYGIYNRSSGDILDGLGTISGGTGIYNLGNSEFGFGGYTLLNTKLSHNTTRTLTIEDIKGSAIIDNVTTGYMNIKNSTFNKLYPSGTVNSGNTAKNHQIVVSNCTGNIDNGVTASWDYDNNKSRVYIEDGSNIGTYNLYTGKTYITDSTIGTLNSYVQFNGIVNITDSTIGAFKNNYSNATITGNSVVTDGIKNSATITIGSDDGTISSYPRISGSPYGIDGSKYYELYNSDSIRYGTINFYDGSITGNLDKVTNNSIANTPTDSSVVSTIDGTRETYSIGTNEVAEVNGVRYTTIKAAVDSITTNTETEVTLIDNSFELKQITIPSGRNIRINFADYSVKVYCNNWITNNGTLKLYNTDKQLTIGGSNSIFITNNGTLTYEDITSKGSNMLQIANTGTFNFNSGYLNNFSISNSGNFIINGGKIYLEEGKQFVNNTSGATFTMNDGTINITKFYSAPISNSGIMNFNGGTINASHNFIFGYNYTFYTIENKANATLNITGGTFKGYFSSSRQDYNITITNSGTTNISGGSFPNEYLLNNLANATANIINFEDESKTMYKIGKNAGTLNIQDSTVTSDIGITNSNQLSIIDSNIITEYETIETTATTNITGSHLETDAGNYARTVISASGSSNTTIETSDILSHGNDCIKTVDTSNLTVKSGSVKGGNAIYNTGTGTITIGVLGGNVSQTNPRITGSSYGIYNLYNDTIVGTLNFYDGIITGSNTNSIAGGPSAIEPNYEIIVMTSSASESKYLSNDLLAENTRTHETYSSLDIAISEATTGDTIKLLRDLTTLTTFTTITIPSTKDITIDMNGHDISYNGLSNEFMINNGILTIIDSAYANNSTAGVVINNGSQVFLTNNGVLNVTYLKADNMTSGTIISNASTGTVIFTDFYFQSVDANSSIVNAGSITFNGGELTGASGYSETVAKVINTGTMVVNNLTCDYFGPRFNNSGTLTIKGLYDPMSISSINTGTINVTGENSVQMGGIKNNGSGIANITGGSIGSIQGEANSTTNISAGSTKNIYTEGTLNITGGTVSSTNGNPGINLGETGVLTLGTKDGTASSSSPVIESSKTYGIIGDNIYFYDGVVRSNSSYLPPINGKIKDVETNYNPIINSNAETLSSNPIIRNNTSGNDYYSLASAISNAGTGDTLQVLENFVLIDGATPVINTSGKTINLVMNNKNIYSTSNVMIENSGTLNISGAGSVNSINGSFMNNLGTLSLSDLTVKNDIENSGTMSINSGTHENTSILNNNGGSIEINGGTIDSYITNSGSIDINDGTILGNKAITNESTGIIVIDGVTFGTNNNSRGIINKGTLTINGGTFNIKNISNTEYIITNSSGATANILGGTYNNHVIDNTGTATIGNINATLIGPNKGSMTFSGSNISNLSETITSTGTSLTIDNSTLSTNLDITMFDIQTGTFTVNNSNLNKNLDGNNNLINLSNNTSALVKGQSSIISLSKAINNSGTLTIGEKDENYVISYPLIRGTTAIYNTNIFNFYDGTMSATETPIYGTVTDVEVNHVVDINTVDDYINATLKIPGENERVIIYNNINYSSLQAAINDAAPGTSTMVLYTNYNLTSDIVVPAGKTINLYTTDKTVNYNGYSITGSGTLNLIPGTPPTGASISQFIKDTIASNMQLIILFFALIAITVLVIVYHKKKNTHN